MIFDLITPKIAAIAASVAMAVGFGAGWKVEGWRADVAAAVLRVRHEKAEAATAEAVRVYAQQVREKEAAFSVAIQKANDESKMRETALRRDAAASGRAAGGLRDDLNALRAALPSLAPASCIERTNAVADVLATCSDEYRSVAEAADRHASDAKTLIDAWPANEVGRR